MIAVAILGVLTGVLVYSFMGPARKVKTGSEAQAMFAEFHRAESQYSVEHGVYFATGTDESDIFPTTPTSAKQAVGAQPAAWDTLRIQPTSESLYCGYVAAAGSKDDAIPALASGTFGMAQPTTNWYVLIAKCDADGDGTDYSYYLSSSVDPSLKKDHEGQ